MRCCILVSRFKNEMAYMDDISYSIGPFKNKDKAKKYARKHLNGAHRIIALDKKRKNYND